MRKVTAFFLAVVMVFSMAATAFAASVTQTVDNTSVSAGSNVTVTITLDEAMNNVIGYEYNLYFNSDLFSVKESSGSATVSNVLNDATKGSYLMISYVDPTSAGVTVSAGTLTAITFTAKADLTEEQVSSFELVKNYVWDNSYTFTDTGDAAVTNSTVSVTVSAAAADPNTITLTGNADIGSIVFSDVTVKESKVTEGTDELIIDVTLDEATAQDATVNIAVNTIAGLLAVDPVEVGGYSTFTNTYYTGPATLNGTAPLSGGKGGFLFKAAPIDADDFFYRINFTVYCDHVWTDATCVSPKTCSVCGATEGEKNPEAHNYVDGKCEYCGAASATTAGYTVTMPADVTVMAGETVSVPVQVGHTDGETGYNAFDMTFTFDQEALELTSTEIEGLTVTAGEGTVQVHGYGADKAVDSTAFTLTFKALAAKESSIAITSAKIDNSGNAVSADAPEATLLDAETKVNVSGYPVTLPEGFTGERVAAPNEAYTFSEPEDYYDYTVSVTVGGETVTPTDNGDGSYTIPAEKVTGEIVIAATKTGKTFNVTLGTDMTGADKAQYMTDYKATLTQAEGFTYEVSVTIGGNAYTEYSVTDGVYTIPGADITGDIVFTVSKTEIPKTEFTVTFEGSGAGDAVGEATVTEGSAYSFTLNKAEGYTYTVSYIMGDSTESVELTEAEGKYTIETVTGNLVITVKKESDLAVTVSEYVQLDGKTVFLVNATGTLAEGKAYAYDGTAMYYSDVYSAWSYLVIAEEGTTFTAEDAKAKIAAVESGYTTLAQTTDVNMSGLTDINDAQLVYDIYNGRYADFSVVVMQKFLNADVNSDKTVNVNDAAAVVTAIINAK